MDAPALCDECGAPKVAGAARCNRCGAALTEVARPAVAVVEPAKAARAWRLSLWATVVFVLANQGTQWLAIAHGRASNWSLARAFVTLAVGVAVASLLARRSEVTLVLWTWVMNASVVVMALTFAATARWAPLGRFDLALTAWAWVTVAAYAATLWRLRRVVLPGPVG